MRKFNGSESCCECGTCDQYKQQCGSDFVYNTSSIAIYNMTNQWYYDTYTWKNWYTAADENTWVSNEYLGYTRIPETGYNDDYWEDYNVPAGAPTKKEWTENDIIGAYYDEGYVRVLNGGFEDGGVFYYDETEELYYRIFQDSADHIDTFVTMQSSATWDLSGLWWWEISKNARRSAIKATSDNHLVRTTASGPIDVKTRLTEYGLTGSQSPSIHAKISDGAWDVATPAATMDDWDTQTAALDFDFDLSQAVEYINSVVSGYGTGTSSGDNLTIYFGLNDPTLVASNRSEAYSASELWFDSGAQQHVYAGDGTIPQEWWPVNDTPSLGNPYNHINGDNLDVPVDGLSMTIPKSIGLNDTMLISTQSTSMFCNDTATPVTRNLRIELLDTSLADTDPNYVFKTIDFDVKTVTKEGTSYSIGYATMDSKTFMLYEDNLGDAYFDPGYIRLRYSDGLIGLQLTEDGSSGSEGGQYVYKPSPSYFSMSCRPQYSPYDPTFNSVHGWHEYSVGWAEWIETGVSYPSNIKVRISHPNGDKVDTFCGWGTTKINTNDCQDMGCQRLSGNRTLVTRVVIDSLQYGSNTPYDGVFYDTVSTANLEMTEQNAKSNNTSPCYLTDPGTTILKSTWCSCTQELGGTAPPSVIPPTQSPFWSFQTVLVSGTETNATVRVFVCPTNHYTIPSPWAVCEGDIFYITDPSWGSQNGGVPIYVYEKSGVDLTSPVSFTVSDIVNDSWGKYKYWDDAQSMDVCDTSYNDYIWKLDFTLTTKSGN